MPPKRTKAIPIIDPNQRAVPPRPPTPPPPPPPPPAPTAVPRINLSYTYLHPILTSIPPSLIPTPATTFRAHADFPPPTPDLNPFQFFLPYKCDTTTHHSRFTSFAAAVPTATHSLAVSWQRGLHLSANGLRTLHTQHGAEAALSAAMKRWVERALGYALEETIAGIALQKRAPQRPLPMRQPPPPPNPSGRSTPPHKRLPKRGKGKKGVETTAVVRGWAEEGRNTVPRLIVETWAKGGRRTQGQMAVNEVLIAIETAEMKVNDRTARSSSMLATGSQPSQSVVRNIPATTIQPPVSSSTIPQPQNQSTVNTQGKGKGKELPASNPQPGLKSPNQGKGNASGSANTTKKPQSRKVPNQPRSNVESSSTSSSQPNAKGKGKANAPKPALRSKGQMQVGREKGKVKEVINNGEGSSTSVQKSAQAVDKGKGKEPAASGEGSSTNPQNPIQPAAKAIAKEKSKENLPPTTSTPIQPPRPTTTETSTTLQTSPKLIFQTVSRTKSPERLIAKTLPNGKRQLVEKTLAPANVPGWKRKGRATQANRYHSLERRVKLESKINGLISSESEGKSAGEKVIIDKDGGEEMELGGGLDGADDELPLVGNDHAAGVTSQGDIPNNSNIDKGKTLTTQILTPKASNWLTNDPQLLRAEKAKVNESPTSLKLDYARAALGENRKNLDVKLPTPDKAFNPPGTYFKGVAPVCPTMLSVGVAGEDGDGKARISSANPTTPPRITPATPGGGSNPIRGSVLHAIQTSPETGKSWSSIVAGNAEDSSIFTKSPPQNRITCDDFPKLGKPLTGETSGAVAEVKKKPSFSATAKPFEPAGLRYAASMDSYLATQWYPAGATRIQNPAPVRQQPHKRAIPILTPQVTVAPLVFPFDSLLEKFYDTPQFTHYLNRSYNELLFKENLLRSQYQRISVVFEDEWNYITAAHRKALIANALADLAERVDRVQFGDEADFEKMLCDLGLTKPLPPLIPVVPMLRRATNSNLREAYTQGASTSAKKEEAENFTRKAYLKWRAEFCFDLDPDALSVTPDWLYCIIGWLLGIPHPRRHRFGPGAGEEKERNTQWDAPEFWCENDCEECEEAERMGWSTEWTFVQRSRAESTCSTPSSPMMERFLDEDDGADGYLSEATLTNSLFLQAPTSSIRNQEHSAFRFPQPSILKFPRLMSNRFTDPIFHHQNRSPEWAAANPGRAKFMELINIDTALFYCELIEQILQTFGEVRRERLWFNMPDTTDYYDALSLSPQPYRGRPSGGRARVSDWEKDQEHKAAEKRRAKVAACVLGERKRVWAFVKELQREMDWLGYGMNLIDKASDREVGKSEDGGLWMVPVPPGEQAALGEAFEKYCVGV